MTTSKPKNPQEIILTCQERWQTPCPTYAEGKDSKTTDNGLLIDLYGALLSAAESGVLDTAQKIITAPSLDRLQHVQSMTGSTDFRPTKVAHELNQFINSEVPFIWEELPSFDDFQKNELTRELIPKIATTFFDTNNEVAASGLLFFLFPMLPVFSYRPSVSFTADVEIKGYKEFHRLASKHYRLIKPALDNIPKPEAQFGNTEEQTLINDLLAQTDWWQRRIFNETLNDMAQHTTS